MTPAGDAHRALRTTECADAFVKADELRTGLSGWNAGLRRLTTRDVTFLPSWCATFAAPWLPASSLLPAAKTASWINAIDEVADRPGTGHRDVVDVLTSCRSVLGGGAVPPDDAHCSLLAALMRDIRAAAEAGGLADRWRRAVTDMLTGMLFEYDRRAAGDGTTTGTLPGPEEYLAHAARSIGMEPFMTALWIGMAEPLAGLGRELLDQGLRHASVAVRLANDLSGGERDASEGSLNVLDLGVDRRWVTARIDRELRAVQDRCGSLLVEEFPPALALFRALHWYLRLLRVSDPGRSADF